MCNLSRSFGLRINANGPAIWRAERLGTARWAVPAKEPACRAGQLPDAPSGQNPGTLARNLSRCKEGMARVFAAHGTNSIACWRDRGTSLIGVANLSPVTKLVVSTGAVSRYKLSRSQKFVTVHNFNCV